MSRMNDTGGTRPAVLPETATERAIRNVGEPGLPCRVRSVLGPRGLAVRTSIAAAALGALVACGGDKVMNPPPPTPPPTPAATITAVGAGALVVHPSLDTRFGAALETPIRISETTGGTADWNFARAGTRSSASSWGRTRSSGPDSHESRPTPTGSTT
jgi:hypothetical protein